MLGFLNSLYVVTVLTETKGLWSGNFHSMLPTLLWKYLSRFSVEEGFVKLLSRSKQKDGLHHFSSSRASAVQHTLDL